MATSGISNYVKEKLLKHFFLNTEYVPTNNFVTIGGFASDTDVVSNLQDYECWDLGRQIISWDSAVNRYILNDDVVLLTPTLGNEWLSHFGIFNDTLHGEVLAWGDVDVAAMTLAGRDVRFGWHAVGLTFEDYTAIGTGAISDYVANQALQKFFVSPSTTIDVPSQWWLGIHNVRSQTTGEWDGPVYQRQQISWRSNLIEDDDGFMKVTGDPEAAPIQFQNTTSDSTLAQFAIYDAPYGGNMLAYVEPDPHKVIRRYSNILISQSDIEVRV